MYGEKGHPPRPVTRTYRILAHFLPIRPLSRLRCTLSVADPASSSRPTKTKQKENERAPTFPVTLPPLKSPRKLPRCSKSPLLFFTPLSPYPLFYCRTISIDWQTTPSRQKNVKTPAQKLPGDLSHLFSRSGYTLLCRISTGFSPHSLVIAPLLSVKKERSPLPQSR